MGEVDVLSYVLDGLEQWLEVERECGVRSMEVDRSLLAQPKAPGKAPESVPERPVEAVRQSPAKAPERPLARSGPAPAADGALSAYDYVFLHDRPLSPAGAEMMAKIVKAMGRTPDTAPVVTEPPLPHARAYIVLGFHALRKYFPEVRGEPGAWARSRDGKDVLITYSPAFFERFAVISEAVETKKREMWRSLKGVMQRFNGASYGR